MPKHLTSPSPSKKIRYANTSKTEANRLRKRMKHLRKYPNDKQTADLL